MDASEFSREEILLYLRERILAFATSRIGRSDAEDVAQETLMVLNTKYKDKVAIADLTPLAIVIAKNLILGRSRKKASRGEVEIPADLGSSGADDDPENVAHYNQLKTRILKGVDQLGPRCKELMLLKLEGYNFPEIQAKMGAGKINTIYTWDSRCRENLRERMKEVDHVRS